MKKITRVCVYIGIVLLLLTGCDSPNVIGQLSYSKYLSDKHPYILLFDFSNDSNPHAELIINNDLITSPDNSLIVLPFIVTKVKKNERLLCTTESYKNYSLLNLTHRPGNKGLQAISFVPQLYNNVKEGELSYGIRSVFFLRNGLQRRFIYKYTNSAVEVFDSLIKEGHQHPKKIGLILVALPDNATGREIKDGKTAIPQHMTAINGVRAYPVNAPSQNISYLEIRYEIPATKAQEQLVEGALKIFGTILTPLLILMFLPKSEVKSPKVRGIAIISALVIQITIMVFFIYSAWMGVVDGQLDRWADGMILIVSIIFSTFVFWSKKDGING